MVSAGAAFLLATAALSNSGCHRSFLDDVPDGGPLEPVDSGPETDGGPPPCCTNWQFDKRATVEGFGAAATVTPRLINLGDTLAVVVTGPSDPLGPSGAHLVRFSLDLTTQDAPVPVTSGSFTWGQPAGGGDRLAVCWGGESGNVARLYDSVGGALSPTVTLDAVVQSPCIDSAFSDAAGPGSRWAFAYVQASEILRVRILDDTTLLSIASVDVPVDTDTPSASLVATNDGFALAIAGRETRLLVLDRDGVLRAETRAPISRFVQLVRGRDSLQLLRVVDEAASPGYRREVWYLDAFDPATLDTTGEPLRLGGFEPPPSPTFDATAEMCGAPVLASSTPTFDTVDPLYGLLLRYPDIPSSSPVVGDTSVLVIHRHAYVAFASGSPNPQVQIDHWQCLSP